jgi:hypothetical protein
MYSQESTDALIGARVYAGRDPAGRAEVGYVIDAKRFNRGTVVVIDIELHRESDRMLTEMRAVHFGKSMIGEQDDPSS